MDPLGDPPLELLRPALTAATPVKIMHAARQDLEVLWPLFGAISPVFDTQVAAGLAGMAAQAGYGELVRRLLGVELEKAHTRTDWSRRPLSAAQLAYALDDVRYLSACARPCLSGWTSSAGLAGSRKSCGRWLRLKAFSSIRSGPSNGSRASRSWIRTA